MPSMPWIKLYTEMLDDPKLGRLPSAVKWHFVALCLMAGECDAEGYLVNGDVALTTDEIAWRLRDKEILGSLEVMVECGIMAQDEDGSWFVVNFSKRQGRSQSEKRRQWRERKRRQRNGERDTENVTENVTRDTTGNHAGVTVLDLELEKSRGEGEEKILAATAAPSQPTEPAPEPEKEPTPHQAMFTAACQAMRFELDLLTEKQRGRLNKLSKRLRDAGKTPRDVMDAGEWWWTEGWRGQKGSTPTDSQLFEVLGKLPMQGSLQELETFQ